VLVIASSSLSPYVRAPRRGLIAGPGRGSRRAGHPGTRARPARGEAWSDRGRWAIRRSGPRNGPAPTPLLASHPVFSLRV